MDSYPKWMFAQGEKPRLVADAAEAAKLGDSWFENPNFEIETPHPATTGGSAGARPSSALPKVEYPMYVYTANGESQRVADQAACAALGPGWFESVDEAKAQAVLVPAQPEKPSSKAKKT